MSVCGLGRITNIQSRGLGDFFSPLLTIIIFHISVQRLVKKLVPLHYDEIMPLWKCAVLVLGKLNKVGVTFVKDTYSHIRNKARESIDRCRLCMNARAHTELCLSIVLTRTIGQCLCLLNVWWFVVNWEFLFSFQKLCCFYFWHNWLLRKIYCFLVDNIKKKLKSDLAKQTLCFNEDHLKHALDTYLERIRFSYFSKGCLWKIAKKCMFETKKSSSF